MSENRAKTHREREGPHPRVPQTAQRIIKQEKDIQGRTAGGDDPKRLAGEQGKVADKTGELAKDIQKNEEKARARRKAERGKGKAEGGKGKGKGQGKGEGGKGRRRSKAATAKAAKARTSSKSSRRTPPENASKPPSSG